MQETIELIERLTRRVRATERWEEAEPAMRGVVAALASGCGWIGPEAIDRSKVPDALGAFLFAAQKPGYGLLLARVVDEMLALGLRHPIIVAAGAQALVDIGNEGAGLSPGLPMAALSLLDRHLPQDWTEDITLSTVFGLGGRAYKDLLVVDILHKRTGRQNALRALEHYAEALRIARAIDWTMDRWRAARRGPLTNIVTIAARLIEEDKGEATVTNGVTVASLFESSCRELEEFINAPEHPEPWDHAARAELAMARGDGVGAATALAAYVQALFADDDAAADHAKRAATTFMLFGTLRQWIHLIKSNDTEVLAIVDDMREAVLSHGYPVPLDPRTIVDRCHSPLDDVTRQKMWGGNAMYRTGFLQKLSQCARSVGLVRLRSAENSRPIGSGFAIRWATLLGGVSASPPTEADAGGDAYVFVTNAHITTWDEQISFDDDASYKLGDLEVVFEGSRPPETAFRLRPGWPDRHTSDFARMNEIAVLRIDGDVSGLDLCDLTVVPELWRKPGDEGVRKAAYRGG